MLSIYRFKPQFQRMLLPLVRRLAAMGVTANGVTIGAAVVSVAAGAVLLAGARPPAFFLLLPAWMFLRMACNAIDGMLARDFGQESRLGAILNELTDVIADAALTLPFALVEPFGWASVGAVIFLAAVAEMAGVRGAVVGPSRRNDGPMGKSDRAVVVGALGLWYAVDGALPPWSFWIMPAMSGAIILTIVNRVRHAIR